MSKLVKNMKNIVDEEEGSVFVKVRYVGYA